MRPINTKAQKHGGEDLVMKNSDVIMRLAMRQQINKTKEQLGHHYCNRAMLMSLF